MKVSVICPNHGRDLTLLRASVPSWVEFIEVNLGLERSEQRNIGIEKSTGAILFIVDSDQVLSPELIKECIYLLSIGFSSVYIPEIIVAKSFFGKVRNFERSFYTGTEIDVPRAVLRSACPKFDQTLHGPEDSDWGHRIPGLRATSKNPLYHHDDISLREYFRKKNYYAASLRRYREKWKKCKCLNFRYRVIEVFTEKGKWKKLVRSPILSICMFLIIIARGFIYAKNR